MITRYTLISLASGNPDDPPQALQHCTPQNCLAHICPQQWRLGFNTGQKRVQARRLEQFWYCWLGWYQWLGIPREKRIVSAHPPSSLSLSRWPSNIVLIREILRRTFPHRIFITVLYHTDPLGWLQSHCHRLKQKLPPVLKVQTPNGTVLVILFSLDLSDTGIKKEKIK